MSFGEVVVLALVAIVVVGPRNLPGLMREAGRWIGKLRRMANDLRTDSGIDDILEIEGLRSELQTFRRLAAGEFVLDEDRPPPLVVPDRQREYPTEGCDAYGALSEEVAPYIAEAETTSGAVVVDEPRIADDAATKSTESPVSADPPPATHHGDGADEPTGAP